jgi:osmotically-inducible protein OsmY
MGNLIIRRGRFGVATRGRRAGERVARGLRRRGKDRTKSMDRPAATAAGMLAACGAGLVVGYFGFGRRQGGHRRPMARDRARAALRRRSREAVRRARYLEGVAEGVAHKAAHAVPGVGGHKEEPDDITLAQKVESIAFRRAGVPKDHVSVNAENGVIYLRGQLEGDGQIEELVRATRAIDGVKGVKNLLHTRATMSEGA